MANNPRSLDLMNLQEVQSGRYGKFAGSVGVNPWFLLFKASVPREGWTEETWAMQCPNGVVLRTRTIRNNPDVSTTENDSLVFVPLVCIVQLQDEKKVFQGHGLAPMPLPPEYIPPSLVNAVASVIAPLISSLRSIATALQSSQAHQAPPQAPQAHQAPPQAPQAHQAPPQAPQAHQAPPQAHQAPPQAPASPFPFAVQSPAPTPVSQGSATISENTQGFPINTEKL